MGAKQAAANRSQSKQPVGKKLPKLHIPFKDREYFTENLALLLKSGVPVSEGLASLQQSVERRELKKALGRMLTDIDAGYALSDALERASLVSGQTLALVRLGEASGHLVENLEIAAQQEEKRHTFRSKVRSALIYPTFVLTLTLVIGLAVAWFLLPRLAQTFSQLQVKLPAVSKVMIGFGTFLKEHGLVVVPAGVGGMLVIGYILFGAPRTKGLGRRLLFKLPGIGRLLREVEIAQFGYLLGTLLDAGLSVTQALNLLAAASDSPQYRKLYRYMAIALDDGYSFKNGLQRYKKTAKLLPPAVEQMMLAGERSGSLPQVLMTIGRTYEQKADITTANLEAIIEPILLVIVWLGVMLVAIAVIVPVYSLVGGLHQQ